MLLFAPDNLACFLRVATRLQNDQFISTRFRVAGSECKIRVTTECIVPHQLCVRNRYSEQLAYVGHQDLRDIEETIPFAIAFDISSLFSNTDVKQLLICRIIFFPNITKQSSLVLIQNAIYKLISSIENRKHGRRFPNILQQILNTSKYTPVDREKLGVTY